MIRTIGYTITPQAGWTWTEICDRLVAVRDEIKKSAGLSEVGAVQEFRRRRKQWHPEGPAADWRYNLRQVTRRVRVLELPQVRFRQAPKRTVILPTWPGEAAEQFNIGCSEYPNTIVLRRELPFIWRVILEDSSRHGTAAYTFRAFARKHRLRIVQSAERCEQLHDRSRLVRRLTCVGGAAVVTYQYSDSEQRLAVVCEGDGGEAPVVLMAQDADVQFTQEMYEDLRRLHGRGRYPVVGERIWRSRCLVYCDDNPEPGRRLGFLRVYQGICSALKTCEEYGFGVEVEDDAGFWGVWDADVLVRQLGGPETASTVLR